MTIHAPLPVAPLNIPDDPTLAGRLQQRIVAEIVQVGSDRVLLSVDGVQLVARLLSTSQGGLIQERRTMAFQVRGTHAGMLILQPVPEASEKAAATPAEIAPQLLRQLELPQTGRYLQLVRLLLSQGQVISRDFLQETVRLADQLGLASEAELVLLATLRQNRIPVSAAVMELFSRDWPPLLGQVQALLRSLRGLPQSGMPDALLGLLQAALPLLEGLIVEGEQPAGQMAVRLQHVLNFLGKSLPFEVLDLLTRQKLPRPAAVARSPMLLLARLQAELQRAGYQQPAAELQQMLQALQRLQVMNTACMLAEEDGWLQFELPIAFPEPAADDPVPDSRMAFPALAANPSPRRSTLRFAVQHKENRVELNPDFTRLRIVVELGEGETIGVELDIVDRQLLAEISCSTPELGRLAREMYPQFEQSLQAIGYQLHRSRIRVADPAEAGMLPAVRAEAVRVHKLDVGV